MKNTYNILFCINTNSEFLKISEFLKSKKHTVYMAHNETDFNKCFQKQDIHLLVIELDFQYKDAITLTADIRNLNLSIQPNIIIVSNKPDDYIQITALNAGADDYICTPIKPIVLEARILAFKNRANQSAILQQENNELFPAFFVDKEQYLIITSNGKFSLPRKEFEMVNLMYQNTHKIFTRQEFAKIIWNSPEVANSRTIDIHIRNIRKLLGNDIIKTAKGIGYSLVI